MVKILVHLSSPNIKLLAIVVAQYTRNTLANVVPKIPIRSKHDMAPLFSGAINIMQLRLKVSGWLAGWLVGPRQLSDDKQTKTYPPPPPPLSWRSLIGLNLAIARCIVLVIGHVCSAGRGDMSRLWRTRRHACVIDTGLSVVDCLFVDE